MNRPPHRRQHGQTAVEYLGMLLVVSVIIAAIVGSGLGGQIARELERQVCLVSGQTKQECGRADGTTAKLPGPPDADRDGLSDTQEKKLGTKVNVADSDGDRVPDGEEVKRYKSDPVLSDTDADGLGDEQEIRSQGALDPLKADEDTDGLNDAQELAIGTNPRRADSDLEGGGIGDGLSDLEELRLGTDPTRPDSDGDGTRDGDEQEQGSDPFEDERNTLRKLVEGGGGFVLDHPFDFLIPTGAVRSGAAKGLSKAVEKAAPKLAGIRAAKDLKSLATLRRARAQAAEKLGQAAQRAKASIKRANADQRGEFKPGAAQRASGDAVNDAITLDREALSKAGRAPVKGGRSAAGRSYQKHMGRNELPKVPGRDLDSTGQRLLDDILQNPASKTSRVTSGGAKGGTRVVRPDGNGVTFDADGTLAYFGIYR